MQAFSSLWATHGCEHERECRVQLFAAPWTVACQTPLSVEFSRQEYWRGLPCHSPGIFLIQGSNSDLLHCRQISYHLIHYHLREA